MSLPRIELIAAIAANGVIGRNGQLAWHLPDDLKHFKALTTGHPVLMGRKTYESIGRPLPNRRNIVVTTTLKQSPHPSVEIAPSLDAALALLNPTDRAFIIGGSALYAAALPLADTLHLTELDEPVEGDAKFPLFERSSWRVFSESHHSRDEKHPIGFWFRTYERA